MAKSRTWNDIDDAIGGPLIRALISRTCWHIGLRPGDEDSGQKLRGYLVSAVAVALGLIALGFIACGLPANSTMGPLPP